MDVDSGKESVKKSEYIMYDMYDMCDMCEKNAKVSEITLQGPWADSLSSLSKARFERHKFWVFYLLWLATPYRDDSGNRNPNFIPLLEHRMYRDDSGSTTHDQS
jgi:hypothetical protein